MVVVLRLLASVDGGLVRLGVWGAFRMGGPLGLSVAGAGLGLPSWFGRSLRGRVVWLRGRVWWLVVRAAAATRPRSCFFNASRPEVRILGALLWGGWHRPRLHGDGEPMACRSSYEGEGTLVQCGVAPLAGWR